MFQLIAKEELVDRYVNGVGEKVKEKIARELGSEHSEVCQNILAEMQKEKSKYFYKKILKMKPDKMMPFYETWSKKFPCEIDGKSIYERDEKWGLDSDSELSQMLVRIFDYKTFSDKDCAWKWNAYKLTQELGVEVCPYCGRQFISTVIAKEAEDGGATKELDIIRAELDHYFPKSKFPMFALSFYNLIPSCHFCNASIKHEKDLLLGEYIHPYLEENAEFKFVYKISEKEIDLDYQNDNLGKLENTCDFFHVKEIYQSHIGIAERYYKEAGEFSESLLKEYRSFLIDNMGRDVSKREILLNKFRISRMSENEILGKFRKDIVEGIIDKYE